MTEFRPKVSIVIPVYNGSNYLRQAIESALAQDYSPLEVVVVNDGSRDQGATREIAQSYGERIVYLEKENGGVATALNLGIEKMTGEYMSWLSHDDLYEPNKISQQVKGLALRPATERSTCVVYSEWRTIDSAGLPVGHVKLAGRFAPERLNMSLYPLLNGLLHGCALLVPVGLLREVGGFDPKLRTTQDYDCWHKILRRASVLFVPGALVLSRIHPEQDSKRLVSHRGESDELWLGIFNALSESEMIQLGGSVREFLRAQIEFFRAAGFHRAHLRALEVYAGRGVESASSAVILRQGGDPEGLRESLNSLQRSLVRPSYVVIENRPSLTEGFKTACRQEWPLLNLIFASPEQVLDKIPKNKCDFVFTLNCGDAFLPSKIADQTAEAQLSDADWNVSGCVLELSDGSFAQGGAQGHLPRQWSALMVRRSALPESGAFPWAGGGSGFGVGHFFSRPLVRVKEQVMPLRPRRRVVRWARPYLAWAYKRTRALYWRVTP